MERDLLKIMFKKKKKKKKIMAVNKQKQNLIPFRITVDWAMHRRNREHYRKSNKIKQKSIYYEKDFAFFFPPQSSRARGVW